MKERHKQRKRRNKIAGTFLVASDQLQSVGCKTWSEGKQVITQ